MKTYWYSSSPGRIALNLLPIILIGIGLGLFFESTLIGGLSILFLFLIDFGISKFKKRKEYNRFLRFIRNFGKSYDSSKFSDETYNLSVLGDIPFGNIRITFGSFVDEKGIIIFFRRNFKLAPEFRFISWNNIVGIRSKNYLNQKSREINYLNFDENNRLLVPWREEFDKHVPVF